MTGDTTFDGDHLVGTLTAVDPVTLAAAADPPPTAVDLTGIVAALDADSLVKILTGPHGGAWLSGFEHSPALLAANPDLAPVFTALRANGLAYRLALDPDGLTGWLERNRPVALIQITDDPAVLDRLAGHPDPAVRQAVTDRVLDASSADPGRR